MGKFRFKGSAYATKDLERIAMECLDNYRGSTNKSALLRYQLQSGERFPPVIQSSILNFIWEFRNERKYIDNE